jgi:hypothetical protein
VVVGVVVVVVIAIIIIRKYEFTGMLFYVIFNDHPGSPVLIQVSAFSIN